MLDDVIIDVVRRRERQEERPQLPLYAPVPPPGYTEPDPPPKEDRGVIVIPM